MTPEQAAIVVETIQLIQLTQDQILYAVQTMVYLGFSILGGMCALAFFTFWKKVV